MADLVDMASQIEAEHLALALARAARPIAVGTVGVCDGCDEHRPRLVNGLCGYCRDGRTPPPSSFDNLSPPTPEECLPVPNAPTSETFQVIHVRAKDDVLRAIRIRAEADGTSVGAAALELIENGIIEPTPVASMIDATDPDTVALTLANAPIGALLDTLRDRLAAADTVDDLQQALIYANDLERAATARAAAADERASVAEGTLASLKDQLRGLVA